MGSVIPRMVFAQTTASSEWDIRLDPKKTVRHAQLVGIDEDSLRVLTSGKELSLPLDALVWMETGTGEKRSGLLIPLGILMGTLGGYLVGNAVDRSDQDKTEGGVPAQAVGAFIGGIAGGVSGGMAAAGQSTRRIEMNGMGRTEKAALIDSLMQNPIADTLRYEPEQTPDTIGQQAPEASEPFPIWRLSIKGGLSSPVGDFGAQTGPESGLSELGFSVAGDVAYSLSPAVSWATTVALTWNDVQIDFVAAQPGGEITVNSDPGGWFIIWPMTGIRAESKQSPPVSVFGSLQVGMIVGNNPELTILSGGQSSTLSSATGTGFAFGAGAGIVLWERVIAEVGWLTGTPEYELTLTGPGGSITWKAEQSTDLLLFEVGVRF